MGIKLHIGMRKIKSLLAVILSFFIWQIFRIVLPGLDTHPVFAYVYSITEVRESPEKTKKSGGLRIRATLIGLIIGLIFIAISAYFAPMINVQSLKTVVELVFILIAALCSLCVAEILKCEDFCGVATIITVICMVSHNQENIYLYAIMRVLQTLIGVVSAMLINMFVKKKSKRISKTEDISQLQTDK